jgi:hypothetical protein
MVTPNLPLRFLLHHHLQHGILVFATSLSPTYSNEDYKIVLVLFTSSHLLSLYKGAILQDICQNHRTLNQTLRQQLANKTLQQQHKFKHLGASCFEFCVVII